jgi:3-isopropylmalate/(R)-2-methylmalate dehydratase small subunit
MKEFRVHQGVGAPLRRSNVDTDQILPSKFLKMISRTGFEEALFAAWRQSEDFVLNQPPYRDATVLVAGPDFGTGSSREPAVWALQDYGFRVIISPRYGDIFRSNAAKSGLLAAQLDEEKVQRLWEILETTPGRVIMVDLERRTVRVGDDFDEPFEVDDYTRWRLMQGLDEIELTLGHDVEISAYESRRSPHKPSLTANSAQRSPL